MSPLLLTLLPIVVLLILLLLFRKAADVSGIIGWVVISLVAWLGFQTSIEVIARSTGAGLIRSFSVSLIVAASLLQMAVMERSGALRRPNAIRPRRALPRNLRASSRRQTRFTQP